MRIQYAGFLAVYFANLRLFDSYIGNVEIEIYFIIFSQKICIRTICSISFLFRPDYQAFHKKNFENNLAAFFN